MKKIIISLAIIGMIIGGFVYAQQFFGKINRVKIAKDDASLGIAKAPQENKLKRNVINIVLLGIDAKNVDGLQRSDSIIVMSIDKDNKKIKATSFMRDMYLEIPGYGGDLINSAYTRSGPTLTIKTINYNFGLDVRDFVAVDFSGLEKIIDKVGGITINVKPYEVQYCNVSKAGVQTLNGKQALAYSRIRHSGNGDYERTSRQRAVINALFKKVKSKGMASLVDTVNSLLPYVQTSLSNWQIVEFATEVINYNIDNIEQFRVPVDGYFEKKTMQNTPGLVPDLEVNKQKLHEFIYGAN